MTCLRDDGMCLSVCLSIRQFVHHPTTFQRLSDCSAECSASCPCF